MSFEEFKKIYNISLSLLARRYPGMYLICKAFPTYYIDEEHPYCSAVNVDDKYIIFFKSIFKKSNDKRELIYEVLAVLLHEVIHGLHRHVRRLKQLAEKDKEFVEKEPEVFHKLVNIAFDIKVNVYVDEIMKEFNYIPKLLRSEFKDIDVNKAAAEEIYEYLKSRTKIVEVDIKNLDVLSTKCNCDLKIKDELIFVKIKIPKIGEKEFKGKEINRGSEDIRNAEGEKLDEEMKRLMIKAKAAGNVPGFIDRYITEILKPKIDWRIRLRERIRSYIMKNVVSSLIYPSKRFKDAPGVVKITSPKVWCFVDESGSISQKEFNRFMSEVVAISKYTNEVIVVVWDVGVRSIVKVRRPNDVKVKFKGGGGTEFAPVISKLKRKIRTTDIVVVLTDGYWFDKYKAVQILNMIKAKKILVTTGNIVEGFDEVIVIREGKINE